MNASSGSPRAFLAAVLIVRDEEAMLPGCIESLAGVVDAVYVHDTGSTDGTVAVARRMGAHVTEGPWSGDFAAARNAALAGVDAAWVLSLDADERVHANPAALGALLKSTQYDGLTVQVHNAHDEADYTHRVPRLFRPDVARWAGRVHEQLYTDTGLAVLGTAPDQTVLLEHLGYADADIRRRKGERNVGLAQATLDEFAVLGDAADPARVAKTLLDLGRSMVAAGRLQDAVDTFETLRELFPGTREELQGTDALARVLLGAGLDEAALALTQILRDAGAPQPYCDWLAAQALAQLGDVEQAWSLLSGVDRVVDTAGRQYDPARLQELKILLGQLRAASYAGS